MPANKRVDERVATQTSRWITDAQQGIHKNLSGIIKKHFSNPFQKPIAVHTQLAFDGVKLAVNEHLKRSKPLIFDSCCGTAMSTVIMADQNPDALVIGIDRSAVRLAKEYNENLPANVMLVQAECADFWSLAVAEGWTLAKHYILYPNPYPKSKHLKRRWHAHPAFPLLFSLGGEVSVRSNWQVYVDEFCMGLSLGCKITSLNKASSPSVHVIQGDRPLTFFEKKYQESGQPLYECKFTL